MNKYKIIHMLSFSFYEIDVVERFLTTFNFQKDCNYHIVV